MIRRAVQTGIATVTLLAGVAGAGEKVEPEAAPALTAVRPGIYAPVTLAVDLSSLSASERQMLGLFIEAGEIMDELYWRQTYGDRDALLKGITDPRTREFVALNYGPWDRLADNAPFVPGVGAKPAGAEFYPHDMTREEFERANLSQSRSEYTLLRRDARGALQVVPYHVEYREALARAALKLEQAAALAADPGLKKYLLLRAEALRTDDYRASDRAWLDMKSNRIDLVIGPIETYEDALFGYKAAYEAYVLVKDMEWSKRLERYAAMLPELQRGLPVADAYKAEQPGTDSDLNAYDVAYYAGHNNAASKTIAINLPNDEQVQLEKGTRRLQLKNAMRAKFDKIMLPIADELIVPEQRKHVTFDAFFADTMFHEVAHGLGIKNTLDGKGTVRDALKEQASWLEEGKADILGLYMITRLHEKGELGGSLEDYYVTFLTGIFRSVRWGAAEAHGQANMVRFNYFADRGAFSRDANGHYRVDMAKMRKAMDELSADILKLQGDGNYAGVKELLAELGVLQPQLSADLARLGARNIPVDVRFEQGKAVLGLEVGAAVSNPVARVIEPRPRDLGDFAVRRVLPAVGLQTVASFIFFDHMGPAEFGPGQGVNVRPHPHIGLATVTYLFEGAFMHRDSLGTAQLIRAGDVNWMVAGRGIVHSERTPPEVRDATGRTRVHGIQTWIALPRAEEEREPSFAHHGVASLPRVERPGVILTVIAGTAYGEQSPVDVFAPTLYVDARLADEAVLEVPDEHVQRACYVAQGRIEIAGQAYGEGQFIVLASAAGPVSMRALETARVMLAGGAPLDGPRHLYWNFVSSTRERIEVARRDWRERKFAPVPGDADRIPLPDE